LLITTLAAYISEWLGAFAVAWLFSLSPRFRQPQVGFKYARRDGITAIMMFALILALAFVLNTLHLPVFPDAISTAANPKSPMLAPAPAENLDQALLAAGLALASFVIALVIRKQPWRSIGWNPALFRPALQVGFAIAILTVFLRNRVMDVLGGLNTPGLLTLLLAVGISLAEETVFRGYIQMRLVWWLGDWAGMLLTAVMYTLWHLPAWLSQKPPETVLILAGLTLGQGLVLGWIMRKTGHVIAPALYRSFSIWVNFFG
jgi:membrane protease YdiL (CAAX protease family)